jgi:diguanylate cyclase (GGDEF)-like protein
MILIKYLGYTVVTLYIVLSIRFAATSPIILTNHDGKAHYIIELMKHITWPNEDEFTHFNIVIFDKEKDLLNALNNKGQSIIRTKGISIKLVEDLNSINQNTHVIFVSKGKLRLVSQIQKKHINTLIISDESDNKQSLMVGLKVIKKNIKLTLNRELLISHGFKISNALLDFAGTKADLRDQLNDRQNTLNDALHEAEVKNEQLKKLNLSLTQRENGLREVLSDLAKQKTLLTQVQTELNELKNDKKLITLELINEKADLLAQQKLIEKTKIEQSTQEQKQEQRLDSLKSDILDNEEKLAQQINELKQQNIIIERKEQKLSGQRKLLYITISIAFIILLLKFVVLRISNNRKKANEDLANLNQKLYELATKDDMTELYNRRHFLELSQRELCKLQRTNSSGVVLMIDIDHFKEVNDNYSHAAGDQAIINVANILKENLREYDIVGRVGGEEFSMFLPNSEINIAVQIAERMRNKVVNLSTLFQKNTIKLTISVGLTARLEGEVDIEHMLHRADKALYQAKNSGRNKVVVQ